MTEARKGLAKTPGERSAKRRALLPGKGLARWELSPPPHPDDRPALKALAYSLQRKRSKRVGQPQK